MEQDYAYGMWIVAAFNVALFLFFVLAFLVPKGKAEWRSMGIVAAFMVALFSEMYGFPLTIYLLSGWLSDAYPVLQPYSHKFGHLWVVLFGGSTIAWAIVMFLSLLFLVAGYTLMSKGWRLVHQSKGAVVNAGVYRYVRHPQYTGLYLLIIGFLIQWPTFLTVLMTPILVYAYRRLALSEEKFMTSKFGEKYTDYAQGKPMFFPPIRQWPGFLKSRDDAIEQYFD